MLRRLLFLLLPLLASCGSRAAEAAEGPLAGRLTLTGSSTCAPVVREAARRFEAAHPGARIEVQSGGSSRGIADVGSGLADLGLSSRALTEEEARTRTGTVFALDGVAFVVHADNPVGELGEEQLRAIFTGQVHRWEEVGGTSGPLTVIGRAEGRSEVELVSAFLGIEPSAFRSDAIAGENQQVVKQVASDPTAISYLSVGTSQVEAERGTALRMLALRGVVPSREAVADRGYPLVRPLVLVEPPSPSPLARAFRAFLLSGEVDDLIARDAFVPPAR